MLITFFPKDIFGRESTIERLSISSTHPSLTANYFRERSKSGKPRDTCNFATLFNVFLNLPKIRGHRVRSYRLQVSENNLCKSLTD